jgi:predicted dehydrogenase
MRFALVGDHPDGLAVAVALAASGRHSLTSYTGPLEHLEPLRKAANSLKIIADLEELLADPAVEAVIIAGPLSVRAAQLRRALQSERHVLCVHPPGETPEAAYEAAMIQSDTKQLLLPILSGRLHPGILQLAKLAQEQGGPLGALQVLELERWSLAQSSNDAAAELPSVPDWDLLRTLGGDIAEIYAFAAADEAASGEPLLVGGRFDRGTLFHGTLLPRQSQERWWLALIGRRGQAELLFPRGWPAPARLSWRQQDAEREETWEDWPWAPVFVEQFESALGDWQRGSALATPPKFPQKTAYPTWADAIRCLELDDAARRCVRRRRASTLDFQEVSEEVGFKGTMTLVGCALLWAILVLVILSNWFPHLGWAVIPLIVLFLGLQSLRWIVPRSRGGAPGISSGKQSSRDSSVR